MCGSARELRATPHRSGGEQASSRLPVPSANRPPRAAAWEAAPSTGASGQRTMTTWEPPEATRKGRDTPDRCWYLTARSGSLGEPAASALFEERKLRVRSAL